MANRSFYTPQTSILKKVDLPIRLVGQGSGKAPLLNNGDPNATWFSQPVWVSTGVFTLTTADPYPPTAVLALNLTYAQATPNAATTVIEGPLPVQNASGTWTFTINTFPSGSAGDLATTDALSVSLKMQNSGFQV